MSGSSANDSANSASCARRLRSPRPGSALCCCTGSRGGKVIHKSPVLGHVLLSLLILVLVVPPLAFIHQRANSPGRQAQIVDWYRTPDLSEARARADVHLGLFADMQAIRALTRDTD